MSKTVTVTFEDEEHTLILDPNDDIARMLENILGEKSYFTLTIDGTKYPRAEDWSSKIRNNSKIEVPPPGTRGAFASFGPRGSTLIIENKRNPTRPRITIDIVHISCRSDLYVENKDMAGLMVYSFDDKQFFELNGNRVRSGYILVKATKNIMQQASREGIVHGSLFKWLFNIEPNQRFVGAGFAIKDNKIKFNSGVFNCRDDGYHDDARSLSRQEIDVIKYALKELYMNHKWKENQNLKLSAIKDQAYYQGEDLPPQNQPKADYDNYIR